MITSAVQDKYDEVMDTTLATMVDDKMPSQVKYQVELLTSDKLIKMVEKVVHGKIQ